MILLLKNEYLYNEPTLVIQGVPSILEHFPTQKSLVRIKIETKLLKMSPEFPKVNIVNFWKHLWILFLPQI